MAKESNIKEELLKQMGEYSNKASDGNMKSAQEIIARDMARVKRMRWVTGFSWLLVIICFIVGGILETWEDYLTQSEHQLLNAAPIIFRALLSIAIIFTVSLYTRSRTLTIRQIQARLSNIESVLRKMSEEQ